MLDIMIDLETLGTTPGSIVLSIGACAFDPYTGEIGETFYANICPDSSELLGLTKDQSTVDWWARQDPRAKAALEENRRDVAEVLQEFSTWFSKTGKYPWSHGSVFDVVLLEAIYRKLKRQAPWAFWDVRDTRTLYDLGKVRPDRGVGLHHYALHDAVQQAKGAHQAYQKLGLANNAES